MTGLPDLPAYAAQLVRLFPRGRAWPEAGGTVWGQLIAALAAEMRRIDLRTLRVIEERDPRTCGETLADWERVLALPDPCSPGDQTFEERRAAVIALLRAQGGATGAYFIGLAADRGHVITITEHRPFRCGHHGSPCGHQEDPRPMGSPLMRFYWRVSLQTNRLRYFRCGYGASQCGVDPHLEIGRADEIECLFERLKPGHTRIVFDYSAADAA